MLRKDVAKTVKRRLDLFSGPFKRPSDSSAVRVFSFLNEGHLWHPFFTKESRGGGYRES